MQCNQCSWIQETGLILDLFFFVFFFFISVSFFFCWHDMYYEIWFFHDILQNELPKFLHCIIEIPMEKYWNSYSRNNFMRFQHFVILRTFISWNHIRISNMWWLSFLQRLIRFMYTYFWFRTQIFLRKTKSWSFVGIL